MIIDSLPGQGSLREKYRRINTLQSELEKWLKASELSSYVNLTDEGDKNGYDCSLRIVATDAAMINTVLSWFIAWTNSLATQPLLTQQQKYPTFFTASLSKELVNQEPCAERVECVLQ